jgi:TatD DNase family protein
MRGFLFASNFIMLIDTHAHLYSKEFDKDIDEVIVRARDNGLSHILLPNIDIESINQLNKLVNRDDVFLKRMMGLHPCSVKDDFKDQLSYIKNELITKYCKAVGEIGIDLYWDKTFQIQQEDAFLEQCQWSIDYNLPIVIHSRESTDRIMQLIKTNFNSQLRGVFHCFVGDEKQAHDIIDLGFYLGIGGVVTFKNSDLRNQLINVPLNRILIETDSPYLAPVPFRGKRNESSYITNVVDELSKIYSLTIEKVSEITTKNALQLFNL